MTEAYTVCRGRAVVASARLANCAAAPSVGNAVAIVVPAVTAFYGRKNLSFTGAKEADTRTWGDAFLLTSMANAHAVRAVSTVVAIPYFSDGANAAGVDGAVAVPIRAIAQFLIR